MATRPRGRWRRWPANRCRRSEPTRTETSSSTSAAAPSAWTDDRIDSRGTRSNGSSGRIGVPMHELVHHTLYSRLLSALRLPSFAGDGLPERMRSISFALLGLTAAAGLALVAIFAQPGFTLLSPVPLPDQPSASEAIATARKLPADHRLASLVPAPPAHVQRPEAGSAATSPSGGIPGS